MQEKQIPFGGLPGATKTPSFTTASSPARRFRLAPCTIRANSGRPRSDARSVSFASVASSSKPAAIARSSCRNAASTFPSRASMQARLYGAVGSSPTFHDSSKNSRALPSSFFWTAATPRRSICQGSFGEAPSTRTSWISAGREPGGPCGSAPTTAPPDAEGAVGAGFGACARREDAYVASSSASTARGVAFMAADCRRGETGRLRVPQPLRYRRRIARWRRPRTRRS